jgi:hypothetical protein
MDLFSHPRPDDEFYHRLRDAMRDQWESDNAEIKRQGRIPDWYGEPKPLSKDKARLLQYLYDHGFIEWTNSPSANNTAVTKSIGLNSTVNAKGVIDQCIREQLIEHRIHQGKVIFQMTHHGEFALEEWQIDRELGIV